MNDLKTVPYTPEQFLEQLETWGIEVTTHEHEAVFTVEESRHVKASIPGVHTKNLFLKSRKTQEERLLIVMIGEDRLDLKQLNRDLGYSSGDLTFCSKEEVIELLGVEPGHVTPFCLINASTQGIRVYLDHDMMLGDILNFHPLINSKTSSIRREDFLKFLEKVGHEAQIIHLPKK